MNSKVCHERSVDVTLTWFGPGFNSMPPMTRRTTNTRSWNHREVTDSLNLPHTLPLVQRPIKALHCSTEIPISVKHIKKRVNMCTDFHSTDIDNKEYLDRPPNSVQKLGLSLTTPIKSSSSKNRNYEYPIAPLTESGFSGVNFFFTFLP